VGGGPGGLAAALGLANARWRVLLLEQHDKVGGYLTSFRRKGFTFDPGASFLMSAYLLAPLQQFGLQDLAPEMFETEGEWCRFVLPDLTIRLVTGMSPASLPDHFDGIGADERERLRAVTAEAPSLASDEKYAHMSLLDYLQERVTYPKAVLGAALMCGLFAIEPPSALPANSAIMLPMLSAWRNSYPRGGTVAMARAYEKGLVTLGGRVRTKTLVRRIKVRDGRVTGVELAEGEVVRAPVVVSNAGIQETMSGLVGDAHFQPALLRRIWRPAPTLSAFSVFLGLDYRPDIPPHLVTGGARDVTEFERMAARFERGDFLGDDDRDVFVYAHTSSYEDPALAPAGGAAMTVIAHAPFALRDGACWDDEKQRCANRLVELLEERAVPGLRSHIVYQDAATPLTYYRYVRKRGGAIMGFSPRMGQEAPEMDALPTEGLYCVGDTIRGAGGIPGSLMSGIQCALRLASGGPPSR